MTRSRVGALLALTLLVLAAAWLLRSLEWVEMDVETPPRNEAARDPYYGAKSLVRRLGGRVVAPRNLDALPAPTATLVLASDHWALFPGRAQSLRRWVEDGGRLVVIQLGLFPGDARVPAWIPIRSVEIDRARKPAPAAKEMPLPLRPRGDCGVVRERAAYPASYGEPRAFRLCGWSMRALEARVAPEWLLEDVAGPRIVRVPLGHGSITWNVVGDSFLTQPLLRHDGALVFAAALGLRGGDEVWFVTDETREGLLSLLWSRGGPAAALALAAIALLVWRAASRHGPLVAEASPARRSMAEQIRRTAAFIAAGPGSALHAAARRALEEAARRSIPGYASLFFESERAAVIAAHAGVDAAVLAAAMHATARRGTSALARALATLEQARRALRRPMPAIRYRDPPSTDTP